MLKKCTEHVGHELIRQMPVQGITRQALEREIKQDLLYLVRSLVAAHRRRPPLETEREYEANVRSSAFSDEESE